MTTPDATPSALPTDPADFWREVPLEGDGRARKRDTGTATALARRLGPFPGWRGAEDLLTVLEDIYEKAADTARARLDGEIE